MADPVSEIALGPDLWYVGCRDGCLYGFGFDGRLCWRWTTPGSEDFEGAAFERPSPYRVSSRRSFAAVAWKDSIWAVSPCGRTLWHAAVPVNRERVQRTIPRPDGEDRRAAWGTLGVSADTLRDGQVIVGRGTTERLEQAWKLRDGPDGLAVSLEIEHRDWTSSLLVGTTGVLAGTSLGRLYRVDESGKVSRCCVVGDNDVLVTLRGDGAVGVAWCGDRLVRFGREDEPVKPADMSETTERGWPRALTMFDDEVVLSRGRSVGVVGPDGRVVWSAEFSKTVTDIVTHDDTLVCAAGVLAAFRRRR